MIVVVGGVKGGTGKTTLCTNLVVMRASENKRVLLVDADEQRSASDWSEQRECRGLIMPWTTIILNGKSLRTQLLNMKSNYDDIFIDAGGRDTTSQRAALSIADVFITPFQPRSLDIWTLGTLKSLIDEILTINPKMKTLAVINRADARGVDNADTAKIIEETNGIELCEITIGQRKDFANAAADGIGVIEIDSKDCKAAKEIRALHTHIFGVESAQKKYRKYTEISLI